MRILAVCHVANFSSIPFTILESSNQTFFIQVSVSVSAYVLCRITVFSHLVELGVLSDISRYVYPEAFFTLAVVSNTIPSSFYPQLPSGALDPGPVMDYVITIELKVDQEIAYCDPNLLDAPAMEILEVQKLPSSPFASRCTFNLQSQIPGPKSIKVNQYSLRTISGSWNNDDVSLFMFYEKGRPSVMLYDITEEGLEATERTILVLFSRSVSKLLVSFAVLWSSDHTHHL